MNTKANIAVELLLMLIIVVITSGAVFGLVRAGVLTVKQTTGASVLNADFIPYAREGYLTVKQFEFCSVVTERYECVGAKNRFARGEPIHFRFLVESSTFNGEIMIVENYRITGPDGGVLLDVDEKNNFQYDRVSEKEMEQVYFKDYFVVGGDMPAGEYSINLVLENPLIEKKVTLNQKFEVGG